MVCQFIVVKVVLHVLGWLIKIFVTIFWENRIYVMIK